MKKQSPAKANSHPRLQSVYKAIGSVCINVLLYSSACCQNLSSISITGFEPGTVSRPGAWSVTQNQAGLGFLAGISAGVASQNYFLIPEFSEHAFAVAAPFKKLGAGMQLQSSGYQLFRENLVSFALGKSFGPKLAYGMSLGYKHIQIPEYDSYKSYLVQIGSLYRATQHLDVGIQLGYEIGENQTGSSSPLLTRLGAAYHFSEKVSWSSELHSYSSEPFGITTEVAYTPVQKISFRAGANSDYQQVHLGIGYRFNDILIQVASSWNPALGMSPGIRFTYIPNSYNPRADNE